MPVKSHKKSGVNEIYLSVYKNCDDALLFWRTRVSGKWDTAINNCIGFSIERQRLDKNGEWKETEILRNRVGFTNTKITDEQAKEEDLTRPSDIWPFQRYNWTDHGANNGETVRYRVVAVAKPASGKLGKSKLQPIAESGWTEEIEITGSTDGGLYEAYFNRGNVMSQYIARIMRQEGWDKMDLKENIKEYEEPVRRFLAGELRTVILNMLDEVIEDVNLEFYAALYELTDNELIDKLKLLRGRGHIVLSNGSDEKGDGNKTARAALKKAKVDVRDRLLEGKGLGHNKFAVIYNNKTGKATKCFTGSTNWSSSGLCTQLNNGIMINDPKIAAAFSDQWDRLADAGGSFTDELVNANDKSPRTVGNADIWFTRMRNPEKKEKKKGPDLKAVMKLVSEAKQMILYVFFQPGPEPLATMLTKAATISVKGVVSTLIPSNREAFTLQDIDTNSREYTTALIQPDGIGEDFGSWLKEVTRKEFLSRPDSPAMGHAITHAKMIVIDPFTDDSKVITGSHNYSKAASEDNDENFVVIHGSRELAEAYAVACLSTYEHYRYRAYVKDKFDKGEKPWSHLSTETEWQERYLNKQLISQLKLWVKP